MLHMPAHDGARYQSAAKTGQYGGQQGAAAEEPADDRQHDSAASADRCAGQEPTAGGAYATLTLHSM